MIYRRATAGDVQGSALRDLIRKGLYSGGSPDMVDEDKLFTTCELLTAGHNYSAVAVRDGEYVAYIGGQVSEHPWLHRSILNVIGWYSIKPGAGFHLFTMCRRWAMCQPSIKNILITVNPPFVDRIERIMQHRYGAQSISSYQIGV